MRAVRDSLLCDPRSLVVQGRRRSEAHPGPQQKPMESGHREDAWRYWVGGFGALTSFSVFFEASLLFHRAVPILQAEKLRHRLWIWVPLLNPFSRGRKATEASGVAGLISL